MSIGVLLDQESEVSKAKPVAPDPIRRESLTEEDKIMNMMSLSTQDFDPSTCVQKTNRRKLSLRADKHLRFFFQLQIHAARKHEADARPLVQALRKTWSHDEGLHEHARAFEC